MANRKISDLTALTAPVTGDLLPIVDISEAAAADKNKKITYGTFLSSVPLGTAAAPSIAFTGDINTGIYSPGADQVAVATNGTGRLFVDASGNVGVNTAPGAPLDVVGSSDTVVLSSNATNSTTKEAKIQCRHYTNAEENLLLLYGFSTSTNNAVILGGGSGSQNAATTVRFFTAADITTTSGSERVRIDSSGSLLVGTSASRSWSGINSQFQIENVGTGSYASQSIIANSADTTGGLLILGKSRGTSLGSNTAVQNNDLLGRIYFYGADGSELIQGATIESRVDGTPGTNDMPGRLVFSTTADGATTPTEAMRIKSSGIINFSNAPTYADNTAATVGGLAVGDVYKTVLGVLMIRF